MQIHILTRQDVVAYRSTAEGRGGEGTQRSPTCVGWKVTLCDPIRQATLRSSEMGCHEKTLTLSTPYTLFGNKSTFACSNASFFAALSNVTSYIKATSLN